MNISKSLDYIRDIKNKNMASFVYKICKVIANIEAPYAACKGMGINEESKVIISLTSFPKRIDTVYLTIKTLLNQTVKPQKVVLWLAKNQFINECIEAHNIPTSRRNKINYANQIIVLTNLSLLEMSTGYKQIPDSLKQTVDLLERSIGNNGNFKRNINKEL